MLGCGPVARRAYNSGIAYQKRGAHIKALEQFRTAVQYQPDFHDAHLAMGISYAHVEGFDKAEQALRKALELEPNNVDDRRWLGHVYNELGKLEPALAISQEAIALDPTCSACFTNLGVTYFKKDLHEFAAREFRHAASLNPEDPIPHNYLGVISLLTGECEDAIHWFIRVEDIQGENAELCYNLGSAYHLCENW